MTLDEMYIETAMYVDEDIYKTNGEYTGESLKIINKFKSAINYAYKKVCRERLNLALEPDDLIELSDSPTLLENSLDHRILCLFAAFQYLNIEDDERAVKWLNLWNDGFNSIRPKALITQIENVYDIGGCYYD